MNDHRETNRALVRFLLLPTIFLTVALAGGVRVDAATRAFVFIPPPLITLILAVLLLVLFVRGQLLGPRAWFAAQLPPLINVAHALTLGTLFFASAQAFNAVLPEAGLLHWFFSLFFLWTLWQQQFASFDARRLLRSLSALFGTAFVLKHLLLAALYAPTGGWLRQLAGALVAGLTEGTLAPGASFAPATGYLAFFTLALYVAGLLLLLATPLAAEPAAQHALAIVNDYQQLTPTERTLVRAELARAEAKQLVAETIAPEQVSAAEVKSQRDGE
jgi:hypothetical protein